MRRIICIVNLAIRHYPCVFLLFFVYLFLIPRVVSYDNSWASPEIYYLEKTAFKTGAPFHWNDLKNGLNYKGFEGPTAPRITRPLSNYFQILNAKFRTQLWRFILPHPSLSLTWIFSLFLTPLFLYLLLRNMGITSNTAIGMTAFYILTPTTLSHVADFFRPAKPMADFALMFCLYLASSMEKRFLQKNIPIPWGKYLFFWVTAALSFYWDETALLIFPAILLLFPKVLIHRKPYLLLWLLLPFITAAFYFCIIPCLTSWSGFGLPHLAQYDLYKNGLKLDPLLRQNALSFLPLNTRNLVLGTMGIIVPDVFLASFWIKACFILAIISWEIVFFRIRKVAAHRLVLVLFLAALILLFNHLVFTQGVLVWGPFWYGGFWSIFFIIWLTGLIHKAGINKYLLTACLFFILINMFQSFIAMNDVYKKNHYYPNNALKIAEYFNGTYKFFAEENKPAFNGDTIKTNIQMYWAAHEHGLTRTQSFCLPSELLWLVLELDPDRKSLPLSHHILWKNDSSDFIDTLNASGTRNAIPVF